MRDLLTEVADAIARHGLLGPTDHRVLVGLSGGPDSVVLLHALKRLGYAVVGAHLDHGLRPGSRDEGRQVAEWCGAWQVPCVVSKANIVPTGSVEEAAREARYAFLNATARAHGCTAIALGHHADDQAETLLFRLARGTGPDGLAGMRPKREQVDGPPIVRPLLGLRRSDIEETLAAWGLPALQDPSNLDVSFARNRIRHEVLPALAAVSPDAAGHLARLAELMQEESDLEQEETARLAKYMTRTFATGLGEVDRRALAALPRARRRRLLRLVAGRLGAPAWDAASLEAVLRVADAGGAVDLAGGFRAWAEPEVLVLAGNLPGPTPVFLDRESSAQPTEPWGWRVTCSSVSSAREAGPTIVRFDPAGMPADLVWRSANPDGDVFQPWGHQESRSLRHFLARAEVPRHRQASLLVLASQEVVFWVVGVRRGSQAKVERTPEDVWEMQAAAAFWV